MELFNESVKVPLIMRLPGQTEGGRITSATGIIDVAPTILDFLKVPIPDSMQGFSLRPLMERSRSAAQRPPVFMETWRYNGKSEQRNIQLVGVVQGDYKLILDSVNRTMAMFHLKRDPMELHNLLESDPDAATRERFYLLGAYLIGWAEL